MTRPTIRAGCWSSTIGSEGQARSSSRSRRVRTKPLWNTLIRIDGEALHAPGAASSAGVGAARRTTIRAGALRTMTFLAGSLGVQVMDDPSAGHDEGAWLGYTAFDPRPTIAEMAEIRSSLRELLNSQVEAGSWSYLLVSQTRPLGSFTTTPRARSVLLQLGPGEPWSAGLRLSVTQQLARRWIGGELVDAGGSAGRGGMVQRWRLAVRGDRAPGAHRADLARRSARRGGRGALGARDVAVPHARQRAPRGDGAPDDEARATLMARGALYALRESAAIRAKTKGKRGLVDVVSTLARQVEDKQLGVLTPAAWIAAVGADDPDAQRTFDALVVRGEANVLPAGALGPCFQASTGEYTAFDPGSISRRPAPRPTARSPASVPAAPPTRPGSRTAISRSPCRPREGDASVPVKIEVTRAGAKVSLSYLPRGARGRGQVWSRTKVPDNRCGEVP